MEQTKQPKKYTLRVKYPVIPNSQKLLDALQIRDGQVVIEEKRLQNTTYYYTKTINVDGVWINQVSFTKEEVENYPEFWEEIKPEWKKGDWVFHKDYGVARLGEIFGDVINLDKKFGNYSYTIIVKGSYIEKNMRIATQEEIDLYHPTIPDCKFVIGNWVVFEPEKATDKLLSTCITDFWNKKMIRQVKGVGAYDKIYQSYNLYFGNDKYISGSSANIDKLFRLATKEEIESITNPKKEIFTTIDGVKLYQGDEFWWFHDDRFNSQVPHKGIAYQTYEGASTSKILRFSTRERAEDYRTINMRLLSLKDVVKMVTFGDWNKLTEEVKERLKEKYSK